MNEAPIFDPDECLMRPFYQSAIEQASAALQRWTGGRVTLTLDEHREVPLEESAVALGVGADLYAMVTLGISGLTEGRFVLAVDDREGQKLAAALLGREPDTDSSWSEVEKSAAMETGNILVSAYLNALTALTGESMIPSPPTFIRDYAVSVLQQAMTCQAMASDRVLVCRTRFQLDRQQLNWNVFFLPSDGLRERMLTAVRSSAQPCWAKTSQA